MVKVPVEELRPSCDPASLGFTTTAEVEPHTGLIGQERATKAIQFGLAMTGVGFNICVAGQSGTGRTTAVREYLEAFSNSKPPPDEWCYVNNFTDPYRPRVLRLPPGRGREFVQRMAAMILEAKERIPRTFQSEDFTQRRDQIMAAVQRHREEAFNLLTDRAREAGFLLQGNQTGFFLVPLAEDGKPMDDAAFSALGQEQRTAIMKHRDEVMEQLRGVSKEGMNVETEANQRLSELYRTVATIVADSLLDALFETYKDFPDIVRYLVEVRRDMIEHIDDFRPQPAQQQPAIPVPQTVREAASPLRRYEVNLVVDCSNETCATVVYEQNPTPQRLFGRIEKEAIFGAVTTDFTMLRPGSLHRANGGFLVLDFDQILLYPVSWNELKRTLRTGMLTIEELGDRLGYIETKTVRPEPIPWTGKVICIAREEIYRALYANDPDFRDLFKVKADFDLHIDRTPEHERDYAGLVASVTKREGLLPVDAAGVARVVDEGVRMASDHNKLSIQFGDLTDIVREADHWASQENATVIGAAHVRKAIDERVLRVNLIEEHVRESVEKGVILVETEGEAIGQVNGLSVIDLGDTSFGQPSRITATIGIGREGIFDLQREARLAGPIHSKAVLTLQGFLNDRYASDTPITLTARLAFEQSYGPVEGDSATCAETCALLSRIAELPLKQSYAITGSMDQKGDIQAIGGANQKIEGFYDVCRIKGLTGEQGVIIPATNIQHLMLREDVVQAVREGRFRIDSVSTVDQALELLTGIPAGEKDADGKYPPGSINGLVHARLVEMEKKLRQLMDFANLLNLDRAALPANAVGATEPLP